MKRGRLAAAILLLQAAFFLVPAFGQTPTPRQEKTMSPLIDEALSSQKKETKTSPSPTPTPNQGKTMDQLIDEALSSQKRETKKPLSERLEEAIKRDVAAAASASPTPAEEDLCQLLLKAPIEKYLPKGYSNPQISLTEMTPAERASGMRCKISVVLQGPDRVDIIRFRVYQDGAAAARGLKSLAKMLPPGTTLISDNLSYNHGTVDSPGRDSPCMVFTAGDRTQTFVSCADQLEGEPVVVSGLASQPGDGNSYTMDTVDHAGELLGAGLDNYEEMGFERLFGKDKKK